MADKDIDASSASSNTSILDSSAKTKATRKSAKTKQKECDPGSCFCKTRKGGKLIHCDVCDRWCHPACVGIPTEILKAFEADTRYLCPLCILQKFSQHPTTDSRSSGTENESSLISKLEKEFGSIRNEVDDLKQSIKDLTLKLECPGPTSNPKVDQDPIIRSQQRILESHERELRRNNIIISGLQDRKGGESTVETVNKLLAEKLNVEVPVVEARRIGRANDRGNRSILVRLPDHNAKTSIMRKRSQLKGTRIFINDDLTPFQKKNLNVLLEKMRNAKKDGKTAFITKGNLIIDDTKVASLDSLESF